jgi:hypothetical protein
MCFSCHAFYLRFDSLILLKYKDYVLHGGVGSGSVYVLVLRGILVFRSRLHTTTFTGWLSGVHFHFHFIFLPGIHMVDWLERYGDISYSRSIVFVNSLFYR